MFCPNCGAQNPNNSRFCPTCGRNLTVPVNPVAPVAAPVIVNTLNDNPKKAAVIAAFKKTASSPLFLIAIIAYTLAGLLDLVSLFTISNDMSYTMAQLFSELGMSGSEYYEIMDAFNAGASAGTIIGGIIGMTPEILLVAGLWMVYASGVSRKQPTGTGGLTMLKVVFIVTLVLFCIGVGILLLVLLFALIAGGAYMPVEVSAVLWIVLILFAAICAFVIVYYARIIASISRAEETVRTGVANHKVSGFIAVLCFIIGAFAALAVLAAITNGAAIDITVFITLLGAVSSILFGVVIFTYKSAMRKFTEPAPVAAVPAAQAYAPVFAEPAAPVAPVVTAPAVAEPAPAAPVEAEPASAEPVCEAPAAEEAAAEQE